MSFFMTNFLLFEKKIEKGSGEDYCSKVEESTELVGKMKTEHDEKTAALENVATCLICQKELVSLFRTFMVTLREILPSILFA